MIAIHTHTHTHQWCVSSCCPCCACHSPSRLHAVKDCDDHLPQTPLPFLFCFFLFFLSLFVFLLSSFFLVSAFCCTVSCSSFRPLLFFSPFFSFFFPFMYSSPSSSQLSSTHVFFRRLASSSPEDDGFAKALLVINGLCFC